MVTMKRKPQISAETCSARFAVADADETAGTFRGMAMVFGTRIDAYPPSVMSRGAFSKTLQEQGERVKILWQHDQHDPIGRPIKLTETADGLEVQARLDPVPNGERAMTQIKTGTLTDLSIGFDPIGWEMVEPGSLSKFNVPADTVEHYAGIGEPVRVLKEVRLWEISVVTFGAAPAARMFSANVFRNLPIAPEASGIFDAEAAAKRVAEWAGADQERMARAYLMGTGTKARTLIADVIDGELRVVPAALYSAALELMTSEDIPSRVREYAQEHVASYYHRLGRVAPWEDESRLARLLIEPVASLPSQVFEGKVLSNSNRALVEQAIAALNALLGAADKSVVDQDEESTFAKEDAPKEPKTDLVGVRLKQMELIEAARRMGVRLK